MLTLRGHNGTIDDVAFSADERRLATASEDSTVRIWDITPQGSRDWLTLDAHPGGVASVAFDPTGKRLLTTGILEPRAKLWDMRSGALLESHRAEVDPAWTSATRGYAYNGATSDDGTLVAIPRFDGSTDVTHADTGRLVARLPGGHEGVQSMVFDHTGTRIATGNWDGTVIVWALPSGRRLQIFAGHHGVVEALAFNQDGHLLASAGDDALAKIWDLQAGRELLALTGHTLALTDVTFSADGSLVATAGGDGTVRVYVLPVDRLLTVARARLTRGWTKTECRQYLPGGTCPKTA